MNDFDFGLYIKTEDLADFAESYARLTLPDGRVSRRAALRELRRSYAAVKRIHGEAQKKYSSPAALPEAAEWLLDNFYMIQREYRAAFAELSGAPALRRCEGGVLALECCRTLVRTGRCAVDIERCTEFLHGWQRITVLERRELSLFPALLRTALISAAAKICSTLLSAVDTAEHARLLSALFTSLRTLSVTDGEKLTERADVVNGILCRDPGGYYPRMDRDTRAAYLERLSRLARSEGMGEASYAKRLTNRAQKEGRHVGFYLFPEPARGRASMYIGANVLLTLFICLLAAFTFENAVFTFLLLIPVSEAVKALIDFILRRIVKARRLPRMDTENGIDADGRTLCVISALLTCAQDAEVLSARLEELRLASRSEGAALSFGILADLPSAESEVTGADEAALSAARDGVSALNRKYGGGFYLFIRPRRFDGESWCGYERKRGALVELARLLGDRESELSVTGERDALIGTKYILTLDSDTKIYPGSAGQLIGAALHPLCKPIIDHERHIVTRGYGIIHPRISTDLADANATDFALITAPGGGSDPYGILCGELYMDAFGDGGFAGKGLIYAPALLECSEAHIGEGRVLSHDALEGAFLRGAYMGDTEFSDGFPVNVISYYKRLHRWTRGDWQNLPWLFRRGRFLSDMSRWRLFDSVRRSLVAPATLIAILAGFFIPGAGMAAAAWAALAALMQRLIFSLAEQGFAKRESVRLRRYTRILSGIGGAIVQAFIRLWLLPYEAWITLSAALTSLWRMLFSRKRLLQWQTAAQSGGAKGLYAYFRAMWFPAALGLLLLIFSPVIIGRSAGLLWLLSPMMAAALSLPERAAAPLSRQDRTYLLRAASQSWQYFADFCTAGDNYLPPDNFQEQPPVGLARRTSPTNIGLALTSAVSAMDMGIIEADECASFCGRIVDTLEKMPRFRGHFYNWYDTAALRPLRPAFISTVDSGNLYACLLICREAMLELGETMLASRTASLMKEMDFSPLYDAERALFHICYDTEKERCAGGYYDLMASEAMLTSYIAVAKGDVPVKHWRRLSRAQLQKDGYRGLASWTGTMFEYLMPELFLQVYRGSLLYESTRFCVYAQRRRVPPGVPWGISESAFFSLDSALNYRYKAHGVGALALKRGQDDELVVSPYSSFLALIAEPTNAVRNLRLLESMGARGRRGFIEALDFTPGRCRRQQGEAVRCYMAHHLGMSIAAAANALCEGKVRRRFMGESSMRSYALLLQERVPDNGAVIRRDTAEVPERQRRSDADSWRVRGEAGESETRCCLLSNGGYNIMSTNLGLSRAMFGSIGIYDFTASAPLTITLNANGNKIPLIPVERPEFWEVTEEQQRLSVRKNGLKCSVESSAAAGEWGELRMLSVESEEDINVTVSLSFEPLLAPVSNYVNHVSFWRLGIEAQAEGGALLLRRLRRGDKKELWLCVACDREAELSADRHGGLGSLSAPFVTVSATLPLTAGNRAGAAFAICAGLTKDEAFEGAQRLLVSGGSSRGSMLSAAASLLGMDTAEIGGAMDMLPALCFGCPSGGVSKRALWPYGVSGDMPLIAADGENADAIRNIKSFCLLKSCGVEAELVYLTDEQGEYRRPLFRRVSETLAASGLEALIGSRGGVHFVPLSARSLVEGRAVIINGTPVRTALPPLPRFRSGGHAAGWSAGRMFEYYVNHSLPARAWQLILTNGHFGCIAADVGSGAMWYENAREMPLIPAADVFSDTGSEELYAVIDGKRISLFAAEDGTECAIRFEPGAAEWEKNIGGALVTVTMFVPAGINGRFIVIRGAKGLTLGYSAQPLVGGSREAMRCFVRDGSLIAENSESWLENTVFSVHFSDEAALEVNDAPPSMSGRFVANECSVILCGVDEAGTLKELCKPGCALSSLEQVRMRWKGLLSGVKISCRSEALCNYVNYWCGYQTIACRLEGRSSLYQSGGAFGFRDQLQDAANIILLNPSYARERILDCCRHQYAEGDVMHWWHAHPDGDKGIRSRCSDDLLWLVWALCRYTEATGDLTICSEFVCYVNSPVLSGDERDRYETPETSDTAASVLEHAQKAMECCAARGFGPHGLPLMGSGDWNDGYDEASGESVWLGWFLACCALDLAALLEKLCKPGAERWRQLASDSAAAAERSWNGSFYLRGYLPDGSPMGGEGRVDSISQSWAVMCPLSDREHARAALEFALGRLVDREHGLVKLFDPPYGGDEPYIGYISSYGRGFRENGGQYTHAAVWLAMACLELGKNNDAWDILELLLPEGRSPDVYEAEPFVLAADVYSAPGHEGEAGWTWYTGSAAWYYRAVTEGVFGLTLRDGKLTVRPKLPSHIDKAGASWRDGAGIVRRIAYLGREVFLDGKRYGGESI